MSASRPIRIAAVLLLVCLLPVCALAQEQTLRISGPSFLSTDTTSITSAREAFSALHEGWTVEIADESAASETLAALESGEETADILVVTAADAVALGKAGLVLDLSAAPEVRVGDIVRFRMKWGAVMRAYTSRYVEKEYIPLA